MHVPWPPGQCPPAVFLLVLTRVGGLVLTAPIFGSRHVPLKLRLMLTAALSLTVAPMFWREEFTAPDHVLDLVTLAAREAILGVALGLAVLILVAGMRMAGELIGQIGGMQATDGADPWLGAPASVLTRLMNVVALAVFVGIDGHRQVMAALLDSFLWSPVGSGGFSPDTVAALTEIMAVSFQLAIRVAAPVTVALLVSTLIVGLIGRTLPQLNVLAVGLSLNAPLTLLVVGLSLGAAAWLFEQHATDVLTTMREVLRDARDP